MRDEELIEAARLVRPYLPELVGETRADAFDRRIGEILNVATPHRTNCADLRKVIEADDYVLSWVEEVIEDQDLLPPTLSSPGARDVGYEGLSGAGSPVSADRFVCPVARDVVWYRPRIGAPVPTCGSHGCQLVRE